MADIVEQTTGHEWDGIEERDTPLPRWWLWTFYATIVFAIGYCIAYPAIPFLNSASQGMLGWTSRGALADEQAQVKKSRAGIEHQLASLDVEQIAANPTLMRTAVEGGRAAFKVNCVQCHGSGAAGSKGYPNLNDNEWLWGGDLKTIRATLEHGIRQPGDDTTRMSQMPAFGRDGILKPEQVEDVVSYVRFMGKAEKNSASAQRGAALFEANCVACHGPDLKGNRELGAPNLVDAIWLYGGDRESIIQTVTNARYGVMPAWNRKLDPATLNMLAAYVHSLGGGE
ncbi:cytochrome-c oxidase, cbb3-type subunit III [Sphingomonas sp. ID1715]|uniref:cytochrome-c oxidase, cbb3-type subunit III n=1 Tax=Sphingomonas sp. ID1715 TaxID=1656898 RepID=UPI001487AAB6|nr:cytochrome-c oxidase, cbb3-type subunit III [Sphingomonas sp. ID1715]NNM76432.1 cytochrome-c oxidase, cbb3-type subunit III [Sphingomonas sp. ID1715]